MVIFLVMRQDYDSLENRDPWGCPKIVGYRSTRAGADSAVRVLDAASPKYPGHKIGGGKVDYPIFSVQQVELIPYQPSEPYLKGE